MHDLRFDNRFVRELPADPQVGGGTRQVQGALYSRVEPTPVAAPRLLAHSREMAEALGLSAADLASADFSRVFGGNALLAGMEPYAANYGGHQFGNWAGQLGDGRAITLGEVVNAHGQRWELQLKGAGPTPYSRRADGRAVLRSSVREFLCSEAMHHLGIPTTRALSLVETGDAVVRDMFYDGHPASEPGAVVCRVAPSFIRFGNFELPASRGDTALLDQLVDFTIRRDFPELEAPAQGPVPEAVRAEWFAQVCERTARLVSGWMRVGFVHGVMNTDNMSILGLTIDYGPYGWIDNYDPDWTPNTTDAEMRRYRFGQQGQVAYWNLVQLANALVPAFAGHDPLHAGLQRFADAWNAADDAKVAAKLGLVSRVAGDADLLRDLHRILQRREIDMTLFFRALAEVPAEAPSVAPFAGCYYDEASRPQAEAELRGWLERYTARLRQDAQPDPERRALMNAVNPLYVLRNWLAQQAIDKATGGDLSEIHELLDVLRHPYTPQPGKERFAQRRPDWARHKAGCSMLSCSS